MQSRGRRASSYTRAQESFLFAQCFVSSSALLALAAAGVRSLAVYLLVVYVLSVAVAEFKLPTRTASEWEQRVWRVIQAAGIVVALVLAREMALLVEESGVL
jgi:NADH:ubiquinone oxidoreductase subunit 6 (subunit J)